MAYKVLIFDFFGVVCSEVAPFWLAKHLSQSEAVKIKESIVHAADLGKISQEEMFFALSEITQVPSNQIETEWLSYARINAEMVDFIATLKSKYRIGLLTNSPSLFVRGLLNRHKLGNLFDSIIVSSEIHCAKPDPAIYEKMLASMNAPAADTLMIDDNPINITAAIAVGMKGIVFHSCDQLKLDIPL